MSGRPLVENQIPDTMKARGLTREQVMNDVLLAAQPTKRFVTPEEVAALALFLCRDEGRLDHRRQPQHGRRLDGRLGFDAMRSALLAAGPARRLRLRSSSSRHRASLPSRPATGGRSRPSRDRERLREWRDAFVAALRAARAGGHAAEIAREGALLEPDAALGGGPIPNGDYRCRVDQARREVAGHARLSSPTPPSTAASRSKAGLQDFAKLTGSQRQVGLIFPGDALRQVFLGTLVLGDEARAMQYGRDTERDVAGFVERIGPNRWRLILPRPHFESQIDVIELVPSSSRSALMKTDTWDSRLPP